MKLNNLAFEPHSRGFWIENNVLSGGVLAMGPLLIHFSSKALGAEPRRALHIEYANTLDLGSGLRLAIAYQGEYTSAVPY